MAVLTKKMAGFLKPPFTALCRSYCNAGLPPDVLETLGCETQSLRNLQKSARVRKTPAMNYETRFHTHGSFGCVSSQWPSSDRDCCCGSSAMVRVLGGKQPAQ